MPEKKLITFSQLPVAKQREIKDKFLNSEAGLSELADQYGVKRTSIEYYASQSKEDWRGQRELLKAELFQKFSETKKSDFVKMSSSAIKVMAKALEELANRDEPPTMMEAKRATEILESLDKITRLDNGDPTEIVEDKTISIQDLKKKIAFDPFHEAEVIEFKENEDDKEIN